MITKTPLITLALASPFFVPVGNDSILPVAAATLSFFRMSHANAAAKTTAFVPSSSSAAAAAALFSTKKDHHLPLVVATTAAARKRTKPIVKTRPPNCREIPPPPSSLQMSSYFSDSSDYTASDTDYVEDSDFASSSSSAFAARRPGSGEEAVESPVVEHKPVPMSKNNRGNRWIALIYDRQVVSNRQQQRQEEEEVDVWDLHDNRVELTEDHVMFCRKANLYNETFNVNSTADVVWSHQLLASDLKRTIGHVMCIDAPKIEYVRDLLERDPIIRSLTGGGGGGGDTERHIPLYRWRHIRDHTLRIDDGRYGFPNLMLAMDRAAEEAEEEGAGGGGNGGAIDDLRARTDMSQIEYWIRSERVIAAGPLYLPAQRKDDPSCRVAVGDLVLFNARNRSEAVEFAENGPAARAGLYESIRVNRYNRLDVTGKFVADNMMNPERDVCNQMREAMQIWGYPVHDDQTPWLNW